MAIVYFPSLPGGEVVEVEFVVPGGAATTKSLLVDSGFTGQSGLVLSDADSWLSHAAVPTSQAAGALHGLQTRGLVICRISSLSFQKAIIAIFTDLSSLDLPVGLGGMVGLTFLRQFRRWGAEQIDTRAWRFMLSDA